MLALLSTQIIGIFLTVDAVRFGSREADARNGYVASKPFKYPFVFDYLLSPALYQLTILSYTFLNSFNALPSPHRLVNYDEDQQTTSLDKTYNSKVHKAWDQNSQNMFEQNLTWDDVRWLKKLLISNRSISTSQANTTGLPLVIKGVMTAEDALLAIDAGADAIMVSNHGGRQLDGCLASIAVLPEVVRAVAGRVPVLLDGGVRRGTDVLKALALGATAVGLGKPIFFSLAVGGQEGVSNMLRILQQELEAAMALCGCQTISDIRPDLLTRHPAGTTRLSAL